MKGKIIYDENQTFIGSWSWYLAVIASLFMIGLFGFGLYKQIVMGEPWGDKPMSDTGIILVFLLTLLFTLAILTVLSVHRLQLQIDERTIRYSFYPYFRSFRSVHQDQIKTIHVRRYQPILEYGGWGYRIGFGKGRAYNVRGNWGLQLEFKDGKRLLIGTQRQIELDEAIQHLKKNWGMS